MVTKREQELEMMLWFSENELYSDGSNIYNWLPKLKLKLEETFEVKLTNDVVSEEEE